jgi:hypothetical protein
MTALYIALPIIVIAVVLVLRSLYRSPPVPPMRTADQRQIERETAGIRGSKRAWWKGAIEAIGWVVACLLIAGLVVPK